MQPLKWCYRNIFINVERCSFYTVDWGTHLRNIYNIYKRNYVYNIMFITCYDIMFIIMKSYMYVISETLYFVMYGICYNICITYFFLKDYSCWPRSTSCPLVKHPSSIDYFPFVVLLRMASECFIVVDFIFPPENDLLEGSSTSILSTMYLATSSFW